MWAQSFCQTKTEPTFEPGSMPVLTATADRGSLTFSLRMRALWRTYVFRRRVIRQKNGADTFYTLHTSRSSGDLLLTNEQLPRVASRRREVTLWLQKPFRG